MLLATSSAIDLATAVGVATIDWPFDHDRRAALASLSLPCLLLLPASAPPPADCGPHEDWVRVPAEADEVDLRCATLVGRSGAVTTRADGPSFASVQFLVDVLANRLGVPIARAALRLAYETVGGSASPRRFADDLARCRRALALCGIRVDTLDAGLLLADVAR